MKSMPMVLLMAAWVIAASAHADCGSYQLGMQELQKMNQAQLVECICAAQRALDNWKQAYTTRDGGVYIYDAAPLDLFRENIAQAKTELQSTHPESGPMNCTFIQ